MKTIKHFLILFLTIGLFTSCSDDDDPAPVNEEEVITTMTLSLQAVGGGAPIIFQSRDADGDGPNPPEVTVSGPLMANTTYGGSIEFLNELEDEDVTEEIMDEEEEHQVFYSFTGGSGTSINYNDSDSNGDPVGLSITLASGAAAAGNTLTVVLKHEPTKPNDGTVASAGGETDIEATFTFDVN